jgi:hypothetical protein
MYVVNSDGDIVDTVASDRYMPKLTRTNSLTVRRVFRWNGRDSDGSLAPAGQYYFRLALIDQGRAIDVGGPITVQTAPPHPRITDVTPRVITGGQSVTIDLSGNDDLRSEVLVYRTDLPGRPRLVYKFATKFHPHGVTTWDGLIDGSPAPAGTYLIGLRTTDRACTTTSFPITLPPVPGTTPRAGLTVRYLGAAPPLTPVAAGARATVNVDSRGKGYRWHLQLAGRRKVLAHGTGHSVTMSVRLPRGAPGLYAFSLSSGSNRTSVPLVASAPSGPHPARILVVLPALTWQGLNPVDDVGSSRYDGDGLPNTLASGVPVNLSQRVLANGMPAGIGDEAGLLNFLGKDRQPYNLTTDLGLIEGVGPPLTAFKAVVLAGDEEWLPSSLAAALRSYVQRGGHVLSLGIGSLRRGVTIKNGQALAPTPPTKLDVFGAQQGAVVEHGGDTLIAQIKDGLHIFTTSGGAFPGFSSYQPFLSVPGGAVSAAGASARAPAIVAYRLGRGLIVDVGLVGFGSSLAHDVSAQALVLRLWQVLKR